MRVQFYGVRGSTPAPGSATHRYGGNSSCVVVTGDGHHPIVFDAGTGLPAWGGELDPAAPFHASLLLTHLHLDHIQGLRFFTPLERANGCLEVYGPPQGDVPLEEALTRLMQPPFHALPLSAWNCQLVWHEVIDTELQIGAARVLVRQVPHLGPTLGYRVEAGGASVAYISDHQAPSEPGVMDAGVAALADGVDLLIHDAQYSPAEWEAKSHWGHSTVSHAVRVASEAKAKTLALFHHDPWRSDDDIDLLLADAREAAAAMGTCSVIAAAEGVAIDL